MITLNSKSSSTICRKIVTFFILLTSIAFATIVYADNNDVPWYQVALDKFKLKSNQLDNILLVNYYSEKSGRPDIIQALMLQESRAQSVVSSNKNCHGVMQIKTSTAMAMLRRNPDLISKYFGTRQLTSKEVTSQLKSNAIFSIEVADRLVAYLATKSSDTDRILYGYNRGDRDMLSVKHPSKLPYVKEVKSKLNKIVVPINDLYNAQYKVKYNDKDLVA